MNAVKRILVAALAALALAAAAPAVAGAGIVTSDGRTFVAVPQECTCSHSIDGYRFVGMPYVVAADLWYFDIYRAQGAGYAPGAPVFSVSVQVTVTGTVDPPEPEPEPEPEPSSGGRR